MTDEKKKAIMNCTSFDEILNEEYGAMGTPERMKFENDAEAFCLAETLKEQRRLAGLTQIGEWPRRYPAFYTFPHICRLRQEGITYHIIIM